MRIPRVIAVVLALLVVPGCGDEADGGSGAGQGSASAGGGARAAVPAERGFDAVEDRGLVVFRVSTSDVSGAETVFDEHGDIDGWLGSYDYGGGATATVVFSPYPEDLDAAAANEDIVRTALEPLGTVTEEPYTAVVARFTAAADSPLDRDASTASDAFDELAGCDWDGGALMADHVWYCESSLDGQAAATARATFAEQAGIEPSAVTLTLYR